MIDPNDAIKLAKLYLSDDIQNFGEIAIHYTSGSIILKYNYNLFCSAPKGEVLCYYEYSDPSTVINACRNVSRRFDNLLKDTMAALDRVNF